MYEAEAGDSEFSLRMHQSLEEISLAIQWQSIPVAQINALIISAHFICDSSGVVAVRQHKRYDGHNNDRRQQCEHDVRAQSLQTQSVWL